MAAMLVHSAFVTVLPLAAALFESLTGSGDSASPSDDANAFVTDFVNSQASATKYVHYFVCACVCLTLSLCIASTSLT